MKKLSLEELGRVDIAAFKKQSKVPLVIVCDNLRSAMNIGSFFRTADALAVEKLVLTGISATPPNKEITKTAIGANYSVEWEYIESIKEAVQKLKSEGYSVFAIEQTDTSVSLKQFEAPSSKLALIFGNEVNGVSEEVLPIIDGAIEIQQFGTKHSLNVAVCAGIVMYEISNQLRG